MRPSLYETGDAMCAVDSEFCIVGWNRAAEQLFGLLKEEALGRTCFDTIACQDSQGAPVCGRNCLPMQLARRGLPVGAMEVERTAPDGDRQFLTCSTLTAPGAGAGPAVVHIFRPNDDRARLRTLLAELRRIVTPREHESGAPPPAGPPQSPLSRRETEVLHLLHQGLGTGEIASRLYVSPLTVRNHIQNIRGKLQARSRLQAVAAAERRGLI